MCKNTILTEYIKPPITLRYFDWVATYKDDEPDDNGNMLKGYGETKEEAIEDLIDSDDEFDTEEKTERLKKFLLNSI